jgi:DNA replication protein DnaC
MCRGLTYVAFDLPVGDPGFGKLHRCPVCGHLVDEERRKRIYASKQRRIAAYTVTRPEQTFETFDARTVAPTVREAYHIALRFAEAPRGWLVLHGPPGTGKSHLAGAIINRCSERLAISLIMPDLLELLRSGFDGGDYSELLDLCRTVELLVVDDMGTESPTAWAQEKLFQILNHRYNQALPTVLIFNGAIDDFDLRIASRMMDRALSTVIAVYGDDYRQRRRS